MKKKMTHDMCYQAIKAQDARFDGVFFTAVKTTGIYCRPICRVKAPKSKNCTFYETAEIAEANGFRPCLRCRPELAPGYAEVEQRSELIQLAIQYFEAQNYQPKSVFKVAEDLGITTRHLSRVFQSTLGVSPQAFMLTKRLLMAKGLLTDTLLPIGEIALMVGFGSVSRFNTTFKKHYRLLPSDIRKSEKDVVHSVKRKKQIQNEDHLDDVIRLKLTYRPPYNWTIMMQFFKMRAIPGVEWVTDIGIYRRSLMIKANNQVFKGWIEIKPVPDLNHVEVTISRSLERVLIIVIKKIRTAFDLDAMPDQLSSQLPEGIRLPGCFDAFEMSTRAILGQQITVKAAKTLATRIVNQLGVRIKTPWQEITHHFPSAEQICELTEPISEVLGPLGVIKNRSNSILAIAKAINEGVLQLHSGYHPEDVKEKLLSLPGIGPWTAEYLTMRALSWPDAFPVTDIGVKHALMPLIFDQQQQENNLLLTKHMLNKKYEEEALNYAEAFRPWRSYLTIALWQSLS